MKEIILCDVCGGKGYDIKEELEDFQKCIYSHTKLTCSRCEGKGRLTKITTVTYEPYLKEGCI